MRLEWCAEKIVIICKMQLGLPNNALFALQELHSPQQYGCSAISNLIVLMFLFVAYSRCVARMLCLRELVKCACIFCKCWQMRLLQLQFAFRFASAHWFIAMIAIGLLNYGSGEFDCWNAICAWQRSWCVSICRVGVPMLFVRASVKGVCPNVWNALVCIHVLSLGLVFVFSALPSLRCNFSVCACLLFAYSSNTWVQRVLARRGFESIWQLCFWILLRHRLLNVYVTGMQCAA